MRLGVRMARSDSAHDYFKASQHYWAGRQTPDLAGRGQRFKAFQLPVVQRWRRHRLRHQSAVQHSERASSRCRGVRRPREQRRCISGAHQCCFDCDALTFAASINLQSARSLPPFALASPFPAFVNRAADARQVPVPASPVAPERMPADPTFAARSPRQSSHQVSPTAYARAQDAESCNPHRVAVSGSRWPSRSIPLAFASRELSRRSRVPTFLSRSRW